MPKFSTGISLKHLFIGGEGCFGIITEATVRVFPIPERRSLHAIRFASFERGFATIQKIFAAGLRPALVDYGDSSAKFARGAVLYLAFEGALRMVEAEKQTILTLCD
ncbi:MAG: FAD-binding oxidoreductase, partial [Candidatus Latescibacteria bacterium]|nr:FAD-binding oxidoreductase [Candidatus Latescibacterota bacterium]NIM66224.1 FAD-binding oxidoreductase [Candidatus Latescibacterota bacterium]NIO01858.1 FAD-binding oxidoreductase [Candidatus Latescibacterota bacterium]NIO29503.1 FAD-binding oxidoreductase [Candidatus Latescibacterota bacterium]NIT02029.1 FAD-binding oxidoreductase [Candidatus Latescibacterota bacterium]